MTIPDFSKPTIETLGRRARFQCSNPDCGLNTVGPNSEPDKAITIGEASHICGAKVGSARYDTLMSDVTRAAITNGIWLCRNCHGKIDRDATRFPTELLFIWRKEHEDRVLLELGTAGDKIRHKIEMVHLSFLADYPPIIQRIIIDKPDGWEWRFVAELMRHLNKPELRRLSDLRSGNYFIPHPRIHSENFLSWVQDRSHVMSNLVGPLAKLFDRLTASMGGPGESGDVEEMHNTCILIRNMLAVIVDHEELLKFTGIPEEGEELRSLLEDAIGSNLKCLNEIPQKLDEMVTMINTDHGGTKENPTIITWLFTFKLPPNFNDRFDAALLRYSRTLEDY